MEFLSDDLQEYIGAHTTKAPEYLNALERETWVKVVMPRMLSGHVQGQILKQFSMMKRPKYLLEVGTFTGYASHFLVEGLQEDGEFHAIEINEELESIITKYWAKHPKFNCILALLTRSLKRFKDLGILYFSMQIRRGY